MTRKNKGKQTKKDYIKTKATQRKEAKQSNAKDDGQDYRLKEVEKKVHSITKSTKSWMYYSGTNNVLTLNTRPRTTLLNVFNIGVSPADVNHISANVRALVQSYTATITHIGLKYTVEINGATSVAGAASTLQNVRVVILCYHNPNNAPYPNAIPSTTINEVFQMTLVGANMNKSDVLAHTQRQGRSDYTIVYDRLHKLEPPRFVQDGAVFPSSNIADYANVNIVPTARCREVEYNEINIDTSLTNTSLSAQSKNAYYFVAFSDAPSDVNPVVLRYNMVVDLLL